jgi:hypothetical protein
MQMNKYVGAICLFTASLSAACAADVPSAPSAVVASNWTMTTATEARFFSWTATRGNPAGVQTPSNGSGAEFYMPYAVQVVGRPHDDVKVEILGRGGWVWARQSTAGLTGEVATSTDTVASATVTYLGIAGFQPFVSLNFNIPTGRSELFGSAANARMDPDLVDIATFGEGLNVGPTVGASLPINNEVTLTGSLGYTWRGSYKRENSLNATIFTPPTTGQFESNVNPGDVFTAYASVGYKSGAVAALMTGSFSSETSTVQDGAPLYQAGNRFLATAMLAYTWSNSSVTTLNVSGSHSERNKVLFLGASSLITEAMNTNSNLFRIGIQHLIPIDKFAVGPTASFLYRDRNGYDAETLQFVPEKERWAAGAIARYAPDDHVTFNARVEFVWTHEGDRPNAPGGLLFSELANAFVAGSSVPTISSTGIQGAIGANVKF